MGYFCQISNYNTRRRWNSVIYEKSTSEMTMVIREPGMLWNSRPGLASVTLKSEQL